MTALIVYAVVLFSVSLLFFVKYNNLKYKYVTFTFLAYRRGSWSWQNTRTLKQAMSLCRDDDESIIIIYKNEIKYIGIINKNDSSIKRGDIVSEFLEGTTHDLITTTLNIPIPLKQKENASDAIEQ